MSRGTEHNITIEVMAKMLGTSPVTLIAAKKRLNIKKGVLITARDMPSIRAEVAEIKKHSSKCKPENKHYYREALKVLEEYGYITKGDLLDIFNTTNLSGVEAYFLREDNPIYDDEIPVEYAEKKKTGYYKDRATTVFKLCETFREEWRQENRINGLHNNSYQGYASKLF